MKQETILAPREHHFYVAIARHVFHHPEYGIVSVQDPIRMDNAKDYGLTPLLLYGLTVAGLPIRWVTYSPLLAPRALRDVLQDGWTKAKDLRGRPDILKVSRQVVAEAPNLITDMASLDVEVKIPESRDQTLPASLRAAQKRYPYSIHLYPQKDRTLQGSVECLCRFAQQNHDHYVKYGYKGSHGRTIEYNIEKWLSFTARGGGKSLSTELDWNPGKWLLSGEATMPPNQPRYFHTNEDSGHTSLMTGEELPQSISEEDYFWGNEDYDNSSDVAKHLIACWPNSAKDVAKAIGIPLRQLMWFTSGKAELYGFARPSLLNMLGIEYDESSDEYKAAGPFVLIANKPKSLEEIYKSNTGGGDADPHEVLPESGNADPSWRYVFLNSNAAPQSIVMVPRGSIIADALPSLLMNYRGIEYIPLDFYRDVLATCSRACREPEANVREMKELEKRIGKYSWCPVE